MDLLSIRFSSAFVRFCTYLLFHEKVCAFLYHFCKSMTKILCMNYAVCTMRGIFQNRAFTKEFWKTFIQNVMIRLNRIWIYKNADEKEYTFSWRNKYVRKRTKADEKRILCKSTFRIIFFKTSRLRRRFRRNFCGLRFPPLFKLGSE